MQIPAKLTEIVKARISSGPPLHSKTIEPIPSNVVAEKATDQHSKKPRIKRQRETDFSAPACSLETKFDGTETEDDCESDAGLDNEDQLADDRDCASDLIASGLWQADDEAENLFVEADITSSKFSNAKKAEKTRCLQESDGLPSKQAGSETETESDDDEGEHDDIPLNMLADSKTSKKVHKERSKATQEASAIMIDKVLTHESKKIRTRACAKQCLKDIAASFLKRLLEKDELSGTLAEMAVKKAIRSWIPAGQFPGGLGEKLRSS